MKGIRNKVESSQRRMSKAVLSLSSDLDALTLNNFTEYCILRILYRLPDNIADLLLGNARDYHALILLWKVLRNSRVSASNWTILPIPP
jgi:hypothetical protein